MPVKKLSRKQRKESPDAKAERELIISYLKGIREREEELIDYLLAGKKRGLDRAFELLEATIEVGVYSSIIRDLADLEHK